MWMTKKASPRWPPIFLLICLNFLNKGGLEPVYEACIGSNYTLLLTWVSNSSQKDEGMMQLLIINVILPKREKQAFVRSY